MAAHALKLIEDPKGMMFEYLHQDEAEFLYEVRRREERCFPFGQCNCCCWRSEVRVDKGRRGGNGTGTAVE